MVKISITTSRRTELVPVTRAIQAAREAGKYQRQLNNEAFKVQIENLKKAGIQIVEKIDPQPFAEATKGVRQSFISKSGGEDIIKQIDAARDAK